MLAVSESKLNPVYSLLVVFESNLEWLKEAWGQNDVGEYPADNFLIL